MIMFKLWLVVTLSLGVFIGCTSAKNAEIIDAGEAEIADVAAQVCKVNKGQDKQISRPETIGKLSKHLNGASDSKCWDKYGDSFVALQGVLELGNEDICGEKMMAAIEYYHRHFITSVSKHKKQRKAVPKIIKLFFMQYASYISSKCEQSALKLLPEALELLDKEENKIDEVIDSFGQGLGFQNVAQWDDVYLLWNLIENLPLEKNEKFARNVQTGQEKVFIQMKEPDDVVRIQGICNYRLRPLYVNTILPVMRLVDMGYYPKSDELVKQISSNPSAKRLYLAAQFCETILPVQLSRNEELAEGHISIIPIEEAKTTTKRLTAELEMQKILESKQTLGQFNLITAENAKQTAKSIKKQVRSRGKVWKKAISKLATLIKNKFSSSSTEKQLFLSSKDGEMERVSVTVESLDMNKVDLLAESQEEDDNDDDELPNEGQLRVRRESHNMFVVLLAIPYQLVYYILYGLFYALIEWPYRLVFKKRLIPIKVEDDTGIWKSYSIHAKDMEAERKEMMRKEYYKLHPERKEHS